MFNKYTIEILEIGENNVIYNCVPDERPAYSAKFRACRCGVTYTEPIVSFNSIIRVTILIAGVQQSNDKISINNVSTDTEFIGLIENLAAHHSTEVEPIYHTFDLFKRIINNRHGKGNAQRFDNYRCSEQAGSEDD